MTTKIRVLVVDDQVEVREAVTALLDESDAVSVVGQATNGADAVQDASTLLPDAILMDLRMPGMDGIEATRRIMEQGLDIPVVVHSAYGDESLVLDAFQAGARGYVVKGSALSDLITAIVHVADGQSHISDEITRPLIERLVTALGRERETRIAAQDAAERLAKLSQRQQMFAQQAAHEMRTPLTGLLGTLEMLAEQGIEEPMATSLRASAFAAGCRFKRLVENLEVIATGDLMQFVLKPVPLRAVVEGVCGSLNGSAERIKNDVSDRATVQADEGRLVQVIANVVRNAMSKPDAGDVLLRARESGDAITLDVSDGGRGFTLEQLEVLFDPFVQPEGAASGLGIGMYVVRELVEKMDGSLTVTNNERGGATISITLPQGAR